MNAVVHVIAVIGVDDVDIIRVTPLDGPGIDKSKRVTAILKSPMILVAPIDVEAVLASKSVGVVLVGNATMVLAAHAMSWRRRRLHVTMVLPSVWRADGGPNAAWIWRGRLGTLANWREGASILLHGPRLLHRPRLLRGPRLLHGPCLLRGSCLTRFWSRGLPRFTLTPSWLGQGQGRDSWKKEQQRHSKDAFHVGCLMVWPHLKQHLGHRLDMSKSRDLRARSGWGDGLTQPR